MVWRQGIKRSTLTIFWRYLFGMARNNPALLERFLEYRSIVQ